MPSFLSAYRSAGRKLLLAVTGVFLGFANRCDAGLGDARTAEIAAVMTRADMPLIRTRPSHVAGKYALMASDPYSFFRGTVPLYLHDFRNNRDGIGQSAFAADTPLALSIGDAHVENFGVLVGSDGSLALEPNDFDGADSIVYYWDVRRLSVCLALAARLSNNDDEAARAAATKIAPDLAYTGARAYAEAIHTFASGAPLQKVDDPTGNEVLLDAFERSQEDTDARTELEELTVLEDGKRRLRRGNIDPEEPYNVLRDLPNWFLAELPKTLGAYRQTLTKPPAEAYFQVLDAARELGSGVASYPRVRALLLVRGPSDAPEDDIILELKELPDSTIPFHPPPEVHYNTVQERILQTSRAAWAEPGAAPLWGTSEIAGFPVQVRLESAGQKTIRVGRLRGKRGTPEALTKLAIQLGALLARVHAKPLPGGDANVAKTLAKIVGDDFDAFGNDHAAVADRAAEDVLLDHERFKKALEILGPTLGVPSDPADSPSADLKALYDGIEPKN